MSFNESFCIWMTEVSFFCSQLDLYIALSSFLSFELRLNLSLSNLSTDFLRSEFSFLTSSISHVTLLMRSEASIISRFLDSTSDFNCLIWMTSCPRSSLISLNFSSMSSRLAKLIYSINLPATSSISDFICSSISLAFLSSVVRLSFSSFIE